MAYRLHLPLEMGAIFPVFHMSKLKKCLRVPEEKVEARDINLESDLTYQEKPILILDSKDRVTRDQSVKLYKVLWDHHDARDATWETGSYLREVYPDFHKQW